MYLYKEKKGEEVLGGGVLRDWYGKFRCMFLVFIERNKINMVEVLVI